MSDENAQPAAAADPTRDLNAPPAVVPEAKPVAPPTERQPVAAEHEAPEGDEQPQEGQPSAEGADDEDIERLEPEQRKSRWQREKAARARDRERAEAAERRAAELEARLSVATPQSDDAIEREILQRVGPAPKPEDYANVFDYESELTAWRSHKRVVGDQVRGESAAEQRRQVAAAREIERSHLERVDNFRADTPDFDAVVAKAAAVPTAAHVEALVVTSPESGRILYHLCKNPALVQKLNNLPPGEAAREMGRIEARLTAATPTRKATSAPPPLSTTAKGGSQPVVTPYTADDMESYVAARKKEGWNGAGWRN